ncbi:MAG: tetratricopeptide repeat protein [Cyanobacteria bacterium P01_F01_bin.150]
MSDAPEPLEDSLWVGREDFLSTLNYDWINSATCVMGLIGFAGEGKSSLARRWLNNLLDDTYLPQPDGVFWWNFYDRSKTVDLFLEKAIYYLCQGQADVNTLTSAYSKAEFLAGILKAGRYLFVLDGLERVQYLSGEDYGLLKSNDLAKFLNYFASGEHQSFCLITSRAPVIDLIPYTAYDDCEVSSLSNSEGRQLLKQLGVKGNILDLLRLVDDWQGHALTLNLIGDHLRETHEGYICHISKLPPPARQDDPYGLVHRVMEPYDDHLTEPEQEFMKKFSAFRLTVPKSALKAALQAPDERVNQLLKYRLLQKDRQEDNYTAHPLITNYYLDKLKQDSTYSHTVYNLIKDYYLSQVKSLPSSPTLEALAPLIEAVHYCCKAGNYDEANRLRTEPDSSGTSLSRKLIELGADDTHLNLLQDFFSNNGTVENSSLQPISQLAVLLEIAECLMRLGRLSEALSPLEQYIRLAKEINDPYSLVKGYLTSAKVFVYLGKFTDAETTSIEALDLAQVTKNSSDERTARIYQGLIAYCKGQKKSASHAFEQANKLAEFYHGKQYLRDIQGIIYADYLRRLPELDKTQQSRKANLLDQAQQIMETNLASEKKAKELRLERDDYCRIHRVLGDLAAARQQHEEARHHYEEAVEVVRAINHRPALASILTARGRWAAQLGDVKAAWKDLQEALDYTLAGGYRLTEVDIYVGQAWVHLAEDNLAATQEKAKQAVSLSQKVDAPSGEGYYWGQQEAEEVLKAAQVRHQKNA